MFKLLKLNYTVITSLLLLFVNNNKKVHIDESTLQCLK